MATVGRKKGVAKTGGRSKGTPNKSTAEIKELAQNYSDERITGEPKHDTTQAD